MRRSSLLIALLSATAMVGIWLPLRPTVVLGDSMIPALRPGGCYVLDTGYYRRHPVRRGDIVVFEHQGETCTKRVYALPGQRLLLLRYDDDIGNVILQPSEARRIRELQRMRWLLDGRVEEITVPPGYCFVLGDNTVDSYDSRSYGCIPIHAILGRVSV
jgi:signal peptidase I